MERGTNTSDDGNTLVTTPDGATLDSTTPNCDDPQVSRKAKQMKTEKSGKQENNILLIKQYIWFKEEAPVG
jgi:hypothetical protein